jgi:uncharacterized protein
VNKIRSPWTTLSPLGVLAGIFSIIGALNWGFVGLFNFNLVRTLFGPMSFLSRSVYTLVGFSGLYMLFSYLSTRDDITTPVVKSKISRWWK